MDSTNAPNIASYKYKVPLIWVDTSLVINMARAQHGYSLSSEADKRRAVHIHDQVRLLANEGKLVYLDANQRREYGMGGKLVAECDELQTRLSRGVKAYHPLHTKNSQIQRMMGLYCGKYSNFELLDTDIFHRDPVEEFSRLQNQGLIVSVRFPISDAEKEGEIHARDKIVSGWEQLRQVKRKDGMTYEKALELEYIAEWLMIKNHVANLLNGVSVTSDPIVNMFALEPLHWWFYARGVHSTTAGVEDFASFSKFMQSNAFKSIPYIDVQSKLSAYLVTTETPVKKGDFGDIEHVSAVLPYCDVMLVDRAMKHRIIELGLSEKYGTKVLSLRDEKELQSFFDSLISPKTAKN